MDRDRTALSTFRRIGMPFVVLASAGLPSSGDVAIALTDSCGLPVMTSDELNAAIDMFKSDPSCTVIEFGADITIDATHGEAIALIGIGDLESFEPINKSLILEGNGTAITGIGAPSGFVVNLDNGAEPPTLIVRDLGMSDFGGTGALSVVSGATLIEGSRFIGNTFVRPQTISELEDASAGAINTRDKLEVLESEFIGNIGFDGGALHSASPSAEVVIRRSTFANNSASQGGAIYALGSVVLDTSTLSGNQAETLAAISVDGDLSIDFSTIVDNESDVEVAIALGVDRTLLIQHSIICGNSALDAADPEFTEVRARGNITVAYSLLTSPTSIIVGTSAFEVDNSNIVDDDPKLEPLGDFGGFELPGGSRISTRPPTAGSLVIDTIELIMETSDDAPNDQRGPGFPRVVGIAADMGAVEYRESPVSRRTEHQPFLQLVEESELPDTM